MCDSQSGIVVPRKFEQAGSFFSGACAGAKAGTVMAGPAGTFAGGVIGAFSTLRIYEYERITIRNNDWRELMSKIQEIVGTLMGMSTYGVSIWHYVRKEKPENLDILPPIGATIVWYTFITGVSLGAGTIVGFVSGYFAKYVKDTFFPKVSLIDRIKKACVIL